VTNARFCIVAELVGSYFGSNVYGHSAWISSYCERYRCRIDGLSLTTSFRVSSYSCFSLLDEVLMRQRSINRPYAPSDVPLPSSAAAPLSTSRPEASEENGKSPLGEVPHQIRGFLAGFNNLKITGQAYNKCTGCSDAVSSDDISHHSSRIDLQSLRLYRCWRHSRRMASSWFDKLAKMRNTSSE